MSAETPKAAPRSRLMGHSGTAALRHVTVAGRQIRLNRLATHAQVEAAKARAQTIELTGDDAQDAKALREVLLRPLIDRRDWRLFRRLAAEHRRGYLQERVLLQTILERNGFADVLDEVG